MQRRDDQDDHDARHARWERDAERQAVQTERRRELGPAEIEPARAALLAAVQAYCERAAAEGRPPCDLRAALEGVGATGRTALDWWMERRDA